MTTQNRAMAGVGALLFLAAACVGAPWILSEMTSGRVVPFSETAGDWRYTTFMWLYLAALVGFVCATPGLASWRGTQGRSLPGWLVIALAAIATLQACTIFTQALVPPMLLEVAPEALEVQGGAMPWVFSTIWIAWAGVLVTLAVVAALRRIAPVGACVLLGLGALVVPVLGPIGAAFVGAGLFWAGLRPDRAVHAEVRVAAA